MCRNIKRDWQQQGNTGLRLCKIVRLYPGAPGNPVERKSNLSKKKRKKTNFYSLPDRHGVDQPGHWAKRAINEKVK
jgi:hypothetical protein